jgi:methyltransferase-like protein
LKTSSPGLKAILYTLSEHPHHCLSIDEIVDLSHQKIPDIAPQYIRIEFLKHSLTLLFSGFLMISSEKPINTPSKDSSKPKVYPVARAQAKKMKTNRVSNLKNQIVVISALEQLVFPYMTGHYTKEQIADRLVHNHAPSGKGLYLSDDDAPITDPMLIRSAVIEAMGSLINSALEKSLLME